MSRVIVDAHCDTGAELLIQNCELYSNKLHIDLKRLLAQNPRVQFFAAFSDIKKAKKNILCDVMAIIDRIYEQVELNSQDIQIAKSISDINNNLELGKVSAILSIEGGEALMGEMANLRMFYRLGVRCITLTWNYKNEIGCGAGESSDTGLSEFGIEVVKEMNKLGMLIDVSHLSELGFWHVINYSSKPIIASHSNAKEICSHRRNLTDEQITALAKNGGVMGINFYHDFLVNEGIASVSDIIRHIEYISALVGTKHIGIGADFDGIDIAPRGAEDVSKIPNILNELAKLNYSEKQIDDIAGKNFLRVINEVMV